MVSITSLGISITFNRLKRVARSFLRCTSRILQLRSGQSLFWTAWGRTAHCRRSIFAQFGLFFATTVGRWEHWPRSTIAQFGLFATTVGRSAHWPPSAFAQFGLFVTAHSYDLPFIKSSFSNLTVVRKAANTTRRKAEVVYFWPDYILSRDLQNFISGILH